MLVVDPPDAVVDLVATYAFPLPFTVICELLGVPSDDRAPLGHGLMQLLAPTATSEEYERAKEASDTVVELLTTLVEEKQAAPDEALVSALISVRDGDERLDHDELMSTIFQLIVAGHHTTASLIGNSIVALLRHPATRSHGGADRAQLSAPPLPGPAAGGTRGPAALGARRRPRPARPLSPPGRTRSSAVTGASSVTGDGSVPGPVAADLHTGLRGLHGALPARVMPQGGVEE